MKNTTLVVLFNIFFLTGLLHLAGLSISYYHYVQARDRYIGNGAARSGIPFQNLFLRWNPSIRPIPQQFTTRDDEVTHYWNSPGRFRMRIFERDYAIDTDADGIRSGNRKRTEAGRDVLVLGDSHSWGLGVDDRETYTALLNRLSADDFTSVSCASFGTARAFLKARQLIRQDVVERPRALVIQYCFNDRPENESFVESGFHYRAGLFRRPRRFRISWQEAYAYLHPALRPLDWPGELTRYLLEPATAEIPLRSPTGPSSEADAFSRVCAHFLGQPEFSGVEKVILILASPPKHQSRACYEADERLLDRGAAYLREACGLDAEFISQGDHGRVAEEYFEMEDHLNALGHARFADRIRRSLVRSWPVRRASS
jgi:hypothetical protein